MTSISGSVVAISGTVTATVSGNTVQPQIPTYINTLTTFRISAVSGGVPLSRFVCDSVTVRNIGNSGDVISVGSLSSPPYVGTSGQAWPAIAGLGF